MSICERQSGNLLTVDTTHIAGYECHSGWLYAGVCIIAILIQIGQNFIYTKASQATREALHEPQGDERTPYIVRLLWYTFLNMMLYIFNILLILGGNLGILVCVLIGNMAGKYLSLRQEKADKERTAIQLTTMVKQYNKLVAKRSNGTCFTDNDKGHLQSLEETKALLRSFMAKDVIVVHRTTRNITPFSF